MGLVVDRMGIVVGGIEGIPWEAQSLGLWQGLVGRVEEVESDLHCFYHSTI